MIDAIDSPANIAIDRLLIDGLRGRMSAIERERIMMRFAHLPDVAAPCLKTKAIAIVMGRGA